MDTFRVELLRVRGAYPQGSDQIELQVDLRAEKAITEAGKTPTSWMSMTRAQAKLLHSLIGVQLGLAEP